MSGEELPQIPAEEFEEQSNREKTEAQEPYRIVAESLRRMADEFEEKGRERGDVLDEESAQKMEIYSAGIQNLLSNVLRDIGDINRGKKLSAIDARYYYITTPEEALKMNYGPQKIDSEYRELLYRTFGVDSQAVQAGLQELNNDPHPHLVMPHFKTNLPHTYVTLARKGSADSKYYELIKVTDKELEL